MIYLDNNATTKPNEFFANQALSLIGKNYANPSSTHSMGEGSRTLIEEARARVADSIGALPEEICFTSGGTESNCLALNGSPEAGDLVICPNIEHSSIYNCAVEKTTSLPNGVFDLNSIEDSFKKLQKWTGRKVIGISLANNETGVLQPVEEVSNLCHKYGIGCHVDAVAAYGKLPIDVKNMSCDSMAFSGHKVHSFPGVGFLWIRQGHKISSLFRGGAHELGRRPGTENTFGIVHLGLIVAGWKKAQIRDTLKLRNYFEELLSSFSNINGGDSKRIENVSNLFFPKIKDLDIFLYLLDEAGILASGRAACSSGMPTPSRVIEAMFGIDSPETHASARFSLSTDTTLEQIEQAAVIITDVLKQMEQL